MWLQEKRIVDFLNVDSSRHLSGSWRGFTNFTSNERETSKKIYVVREETDKDSNGYRTRSCMARSLDENGNAAQNREKQELAKERPKLDNARNMRGVYFIDPDDEEYKRNSQEVRGRKLERSYGSSHGVQKTIEHHESGCEAGNCIREEFQNSVWMKSGVS